MWIHYTGSYVFSLKDLSIFAQLQTKSIHIQILYNYIHYNFNLNECPIVRVFYITETSNL